MPNLISGADMTEQLCRPNRLGASGNTATLKIRSYSRFSTSVKPSVDNFFYRYDSTADKVVFDARIREFLEPGANIVFREFGVQAEPQYKVIPELSRIRILIGPSPWVVAPRGTAAFAKFAPMLGTVPNSIEAIRWMLFLNGDITVIGDKEIAYDIEMNLTFEQKRGIDAQYRPAKISNYEDCERLGSAVAAKLLDTYVRYLRDRYELAVEKRDGTGR
jgi:hypothetical protein